MRIKKKNKTKTKFIGARASDREENEIKLKANIYTEGNISEWIIYAACNHIPRSEDLERT